MCNAHNHHIGCNCGWGGDGHQGYAYIEALFNQQRLISHQIDFDEYDSYVNPNAICPVCGASVYFYQSSYGGRVYFDELGPPWPKHPCTIDEYKIPDFNRSENVNTPQWIKHGWKPFRLTQIEKVANYLSITGKVIDEENKTKNIKRYYIQNDEDLNKNLLCFMRAIDENSFELLYLSIYPPKQLKLVAHKNRFALRKKIKSLKPLKKGDKLVVGYKGYQTEEYVRVHLLDRQNTEFKCYIKKKDLRERTLGLIESQPNKHLKIQTLVDHINHVDKHFILIEI